MRVEPSFIVFSADGTPIVGYELGGTGEPLLIAHATGFCGAMYRLLTEHLATRFRVVAFDFRGHGDSGFPANDDLTWHRMAEDVLAVAQHLGTDALHGFGHSMGGSALALAEHVSPGTFRSLFLFEPIIFPPDFPSGGQNVLAMAARKRRPAFTSRAEALYRYGGRPPLQQLVAGFLVDYMDNGFADDDDGIRLKCSPETEARVFEWGRNLDFALVDDVKTPTTLAVGNDAGPSPAAMGPDVADGLVNGHLHRYDHIGHFGPFQDPWTIARDIVAASAAQC